MNGQEYEQLIYLYRNMKQWCFAAAVLFFAVSLALFFVFKITVIVHQYIRSGFGRISIKKTASQSIVHTKKLEPEKNFFIVERSIAEVHSDEVI